MTMPKPLQRIEQDLTTHLMLCFLRSWQDVGALKLATQVLLPLAELLA